jgi:hypothetical protein
MYGDPFEGCWHRIERAETHRKAAADVWNGFIKDHPYDFTLDHQGEGRFLLRVFQQLPTPPEMAVLIGEWLYNLRCALDYCVYATAVSVSGQDPPPGQGVLQFPIYGSEVEFRKNEYRLKPLAEHQRTLLEVMQPYKHPDPDTSALAWINRLARIDRHRRLTVMTSYMAEMRPIVGAPKDCTVDLEFGERVIVDNEAKIARFTVTPWQDGWHVEANPQLGIDPEVREWTESSFWRRIDYNERLRMLRSVVKSMVVTFEYDCLGYSRDAEILTAEFRAECDARRQPGKGLRTSRAW